MPKQTPEQRGESLADVATDLVESIKPRLETANDRELEAFRDLLLAIEPLLRREQERVLAERDRLRARLRAEHPHLQLTREGDDG